MMLTGQQIDDAIPETIEVQIADDPDDEFNLASITVCGPEGEAGELFRTRRRHLRGAQQDTTARLLQLGYAPTERWRTTRYADGTVAARRRYSRAAAVDTSHSPLGLGEYYCELAEALSNLGCWADEDPMEIADLLRFYNDSSDLDHMSLGAQVNEIALWLTEVAAGLGNLGRWVESDDGMTSRWVPDDQ